MEESVLPLVLFEIWIILKCYPSMFPALSQFYKTAVLSLSADEAGELAGFVENQKVCFLLVACLLYWLMCVQFLESSPPHLMRTVQG